MTYKTVKLNFDKPNIPNFYKYFDFKIRKSLNNNSWVINENIIIKTKELIENWDNNNEILIPHPFYYWTISLYNNVGKGHIEIVSGTFN